MSAAHRRQRRLGALLPRRLFLRMSAICGMLILIGAAVEYTFLIVAAPRVIDEVEQNFNWGLAKTFAIELQPHLQQGLDDPELLDQLLRLLAINPRLVVLFFDAAGNLLGFAEHQSFAVTSDRQAYIEKFRDVYRLSPAMIDQFFTFQVNRELPQRGIKIASYNPFRAYSLARIEIAGEPAYLYLGLLNSNYSKMLISTRNFAAMYGGVLSLPLLIAVVVLVGTVLFFLLTRRLSSLVHVVRAIAAGDFSRRAQFEGEDEVAELARNVNLMAEQIESNIAELKRQDRLRRDLIADISHEFGGPLAAVSGHLQLLAAGGRLSDSDHLQYVEVAQSNTAHLVKLSEELLDLARFEAKEIQPVLEEFDITEIITTEIVPRFHPAAIARGMEISVEYPQDGVYVSADMKLIERVLSNLVGNAVRYGREGGKITVKVQEQEAVVSIAVSDDGPGIAEQDLPHLFDRFFRTTSAKRAAKGTGLGLAIVKGIIEAHSQSIAVESELGRGTTFTFTLQAAG